MLGTVTRAVGQTQRDTQADGGVRVQLWTGGWGEWLQTERTQDRLAGATLDLHHFLPLPRERIERTC